MGTKHLCLLSAVPLAVSLALSAGCSPIGMAVGAGATAGVLAVQERSVADALDDTVIEVAVNQRLAEADFGELFQAVVVDTVEGRVLLTGRVTSVELRDQATQIAWQVDNVEAVLNEIEVGDIGGGAVNYMRDRKITADLRSRLLGDGGVRHINYWVTTNDGVIFLMGIARDRDEVSRVVAHAREIPHVRKVVDHVMLRDDPRRQDRPQ